MTIRKKLLLFWVAVTLQFVASRVTEKYFGYVDDWRTSSCNVLLVAALYGLGRYSQRVDPDPVT
jgi:hypothetical protein